MKKKLIQILMLMVATVSVGSFVSCKDTNEDLYNELRTKSIADDATLKQALEARIAELEGIVAGIKSCECPDSATILAWAHGEDAWLQAQIDAINAALTELAKLDALDNYYTKDQVDGLIHGLQDQIDIITATFATNENLAKLAERVAAIEGLKDKVAAIEEQIAKIKSCECDYVSVTNRLTALETLLNELKPQVEQAIKDIKAVEDLAKAAQTAADNAQAAADNAKTIAETAQKAADNAQSTADAAKLIADTFKDLYETAANNATEAKTMAQEAKTLAENNKTAIENLQKKVDELDGKVNAATEAANNALTKASEAAAKADANKELIDKLSERVTANETNIKNLQEKVAAMEKLAEQVGANTEAINNLKTEISNLKGEIKKVDKLAEEVAALKQQVEDCQKICKTNLEAAKAEIRLEIETLKTELVDRISANEAEIKEHHEALQQIAEMIKGLATKEYVDNAVDDAKKELQEAIDAVDKKLTEYQEKIDKEISDITDRLDSAEGRLDTAEEKLKNLEEVTIKEIKEDISNLTTKYNELKEVVDAMEPRIKAAEDKLAEIEPIVNNLKTDVAAIQDYLRSQITGLNVQGTYNPMFGSFSIPANIQSNVLVAYYGELKKDVWFPTARTGNYVRPKEALTAADMEILGLDDNGEPLLEATEILMNGEDEDGKAYGGKVYVTVNPTTTDFTGAELTLVNTQDKPSAFELSPLKKSDATLQFGFTRADNGFYEADAYITVPNKEAEFSFSEENLEALIYEARMKMYEAAENFLNSTGASGDLGGLATKLYNIIHELRIDQYGLKCPFKDFEGNDQALYSQYNVAATVLKPLNLATFKDLHYYTIPGYEEMNEFLDRIAATLNDHVHVMFQDANGSWKVNKLFNGLNIEGVDLADYTDNLIARFSTRVSGFTLNGVNYILTIPGSGSVDVKFATDLKANGSAVTVPANVAFNLNDIPSNSITRVTIVIGGDVKNGMTTTLVIPAVDGDGIISAYASMELIDASVKATLVGSDIVLWSADDGTFNVATYSGNAITLTKASLVLQNLTGSNGSINLPVVEEIAGDAQKIVDELRAFLEELNHTLAEINKYDDIIAGENGWINKFINQYIRKYLDKINNTTVYFFNSINRRFGPFLCASNDYKGFKRLSTSKYAPTELNKEGLKFYPTTKNMELIVPIARKHVAVTDVFDESGYSAKKDGIYKDHVQAINSQNEELNKVLDGTERMISVDTSKMKSGYTYEIAYSVLDFEGNISTTKYYIKITE